MQSVIEKVQMLVRFVCSIALALMSTVVLMQVVDRNVFGDSFQWVEELSTMCMVWITFLGAALATSMNAHTRIELFVNLLPKPLPTVIFGLGDLLCAVFSCALAWYSLPLIAANLHTMSPAMRLPLCINYIVFLVAVLLTAAFLLLRVADAVRSLAGSTKEA